MLSTLIFKEIKRRISWLLCGSAATPPCFPQEALCEGVSEAQLVPGLAGCPQEAAGLEPPCLGRGAWNIKASGWLQQLFSSAGFLPWKPASDVGSGLGARLWEMAVPWPQRGPWASPCAPVPLCDLCRAVVSPAVASWCHCGNTDRFRGSGAFGSGQEHFFPVAERNLAFCTHSWKEASILQGCKWSFSCDWPQYHWS